jgi:hypothetical protein
MSQTGQDTGMRVRNVWNSRWLQRRAIPVLIFILALLPRSVYPVSRPIQWYSRAILFGDALLARDWAGTYQRYHPGVTTMWLSGIGLKLLGWQRGLSSGQLLGLAPAKPGTLNDGVTAGVIPLAFAIALCIALTYPLLSRIVGRKAALAGSCLLALNPFYIAYSKVVHVDALLATFMLVSALFLISHLQHGTRSDLILSGLFAGLAFLTKSPGLFLIPYAGLAVGMYRLVESESDCGQRARITGWLRQIVTLMGVLAIWAGIAAATFVVLWPAMWVEPLDALRQVGGRIIFHVETVHRNPIFFNGQVMFEDPGLPFYLATVAWKTTLVTLPACCAALVFALLWFRRSGPSRVAGLLIAYGVFFTIQMGLSARKELPYLLPVFPALDVAAAVGLVQGAEAIGRLRWWRNRGWISTALVALAVALQAIVVLPRHPYYGTHHNALLGGSRVARRILPLQDQGEGLDLAARYLNTLPRAQRATAGLYQRSAAIFRHNFVGLTSVVNDPSVNYRIYYVNQTMRHLGGEEWDNTWAVDQQTPPLWSVDFDGVTYVWVYGAPPGEPAPGGPEYELDYRLGEHVQLRQVRLSAQMLAPGDTLIVVLNWVSDGEIKRSYNVFCHLLSASGELAGQRDGVPLRGIRPTLSWRAGEIIEDSYEILLDDNVAPGEYELWAGMYDLETMERLDVYDATGERLADGQIPVGSVRVQELRTRE